MENEPVQQLRVEVGGLLRQELASTHDRLQLRGRRRGDQERRLTLALAGEPDRLGPVRRNAGNPEIALSRNEVLTERTDVIGAAFLFIVCSPLRSLREPPTTADERAAVTAGHRLV